MFALQFLILLTLAPSSTNTANGEVARAISRWINAAKRDEGMKQMPIDDDPLDISLRQVRQELESDIERDLSLASCAAVLCLIPGIGSAIQSLLDGKAQRNVERRWVQLFVDLKERLDQIRDDIPDDEYYASEEFQTILALTYQEILTTHDREKLRLLATALANSGREKFREEDKEQLVRTLRDLSPRDIRTLAVLKPRPHGWIDNPPAWLRLTREKWRNPIEEDLCSLTRLVGLGLVTEGLEGTPPPSGGSGSERIDAEQRFRYALEPHAPVRVFQISPYGIRFISFIETEDQPTQTDSGEVIS